MNDEEGADFWPQQQGADGVDELEERYNRLVSKLMILQGQREKDEITDSQARRRFQGLQQAIRTWVNKVRHDLLRNGHQDVVRQAVDGGYDRPGMRKLMYLLSVNGKTAETDDASTAFTPDDIVWAHWLGLHPTALHVVLFLGVWSDLQKYILRRSFPIGIDERSEQMFLEVIKTMDKERAQRWMSQTMTALAKTAIFKKGRAAQMELISNEMRSQLEVWPLRPFSTRSTHYQSLKELVKLAADLHRDLRCSKDRFEMVYPRNLVRGSLPDDVSHWDLMNLTQWLLLSGKEDSEGALLCLYPGLE
ncbi:hypothetical protein J3459_016966 [Metarhizium acridum]|nr:hypothetical protein J3459_016966 [Metarhizium acridum]